MEKNYVFIVDPGHGWLEVPENDASGIKFSKYSPRKKGKIYLEEDCDAPKFLKIMEDRGIRVNITTRHVEQFQR